MSDLDLNLLALNSVSYIFFYYIRYFFLQISNLFPSIIIISRTKPPCHISIQPTFLSGSKPPCPYLSSSQYLTACFKLALSNNRLPFFVSFFPNNRLPSLVSLISICRITASNSSGNLKIEDIFRVSPCRVFY